MSRFHKKIERLLKKAKQYRDDLDSWKPEHPHVKAELRNIKHFLTSLVVSLQKVNGALINDSCRSEELKRILNLREMKKHFRYLYNYVEMLKSKYGEEFASRARRYVFHARLGGK